MALFFNDFYKKRYLSIDILIFLWYNKFKDIGRNFVTQNYKKKAAAFMRADEFLYFYVDKCIILWCNYIIRYSYVPFHII